MGCTEWIQADGWELGGLFPAGMTIVYHMGMVEVEACSGRWRELIQGLRALGWSILQVALV